MSHSTSFFNNPLLVSEKKTRAEYCAVNVGGELFHALAVALIDGAKTSQFKDGTLKKILDALFTSYPQYKVSQAYHLTLSERMGMVIGNARKSELVECIAYVLRQLMVDELYAQPLKYRDTFDKFSPETEKNQLRQLNVPLPACAMKALAYCLGIKITLSFKELEKDLRSRTFYNGDAPAGITIQVQGNHYFPIVKHKNDFAYVGQIAISPPLPVHPVMESGETLAETMSIIATDNKQLVHSYSQCCKNLFNMFSAGELTKEDLIDAFINFLPGQKDASELMVPSSFFARLYDMEQGNAVNQAFATSEQQLVKLLVSALAASIATQHVDFDDLVDFIDKRPMPRSCPAA